MRQIFVALLQSPVKTPFLEFRRRGQSSLVVQFQTCMIIVKTRAKENVKTNCYGLTLFVPVKLPCGSSSQPTALWACPGVWTEFVIMKRALFSWAGMV
jgi:hypothetical protein